MSQRRKRVRLFLNSQTLWHLERFAAADGHPGDIGRSVDKVVREKLIHDRPVQILAEKRGSCE